MQDPTLGFYDANAANMTSSYEAVDFTGSLAPLVRSLPDHSRVLEIGCGSGRDAAYLEAMGHFVVGTDGSVEMIRQAESIHPTLAGRLRHHELPDRLPFDTPSFAAVMSWAVLMHLQLNDLPSVFKDLARVLLPHGLLAYSVNTERAGLDHDGNDSKGRHFTCLNASDWACLHEHAGFKTLSTEETNDITGRPGIRWVTFLAVLDDQ